MDLTLVLAIVGVLLGAPALAYAWHTDRGVGHTLKDAKATLEGLEQANVRLDESVAKSAEVLLGLTAVQQGLSTRARGSFPRYLPTIVELLKGAEESAKILCDLPAYGAFSSPTRWRQYQRALTDLALRSNPSDKFDLQIVCLSRERCRAHITEQFPADAWQRLISDDPEFRDKLSSFRRDNDPTETAGPHSLTDRDAFIELAMYVEDAERERLGTAEVDITFPLYLWIVDGKRAVFAVASLPPSPSAEAASGTTREVGFETDDPLLIDALKAIFDQYRLSANNR